MEKTQQQAADISAEMSKKDLLDSLILLRNTLFQDINAQKKEHYAMVNKYEATIRQINKLNQDYSAQIKLLQQKLPKEEQKKRQFDELTPEQKEIQDLKISNAKLEYRVNHLLKTITQIEDSNKKNLQEKHQQISSLTEQIQKK